MCVHRQRCIDKNNIFNTLRTGASLLSFHLEGEKHLTGSNLHMLIINKVETDGSQDVLGHWV